LTDPELRHVVLDVNVLTRLSEIDPACELVEFLGACLDGQCYIYEPQARLAPCPSASLDCCSTINVTDDEAAAFLYGYAGSLKIDRLLNEPGDTKAVFHATTHHKSVVVSCDRGVLIVCADIGLEHYCFKAAVGLVDNFLSGYVFRSGRYTTRHMFIPSERTQNPFVLYSFDRHCPVCDPLGRCASRKDLR